MNWIKQNMMVALLCAALAACASSYFIGRLHQNAAHQKKIMAAQLEGHNRANNLSIQLANAEQELLEQQRLLEEAAHADQNVSTGTCLPAARVRRLNLR